MFYEGGTVASVSAHVGLHPEALVGRMLRRYGASPVRSAIRAGARMRHLDTWMRVESSSGARGILKAHAPRILIMESSPGLPAEVIWVDEVTAGERKRLVALASQAFSRLHVSPMTMVDVAFGDSVDDRESVSE